MRKTIEYLLWASTIFYYIVYTIGQDFERSYCYNDDDEDNNTFLDFMDTLETFTFNIYSIEITNCTNGQETPSEYTYTLDSSVVWVKRFEIYDEFRDDMSLCKNCSTIDFQECMKTIRTEMSIRIENKTQEIWDFLLITKQELESNCL